MKPLFKGDKLFKERGIKVEKDLIPFDLIKKWIKYLVKLGNKIEHW